MSRPVTPKEVDKVFKALAKWQAMGRSGLTIWGLATVLEITPRRALQLLNCRLAKRNGRPDLPVWHPDATLSLAGGYCETIQRPVFGVRRPYQRRAVDQVNVSRAISESRKSLKDGILTEEDATRHYKLTDNQVISLRKAANK